MEKQQSRWPPHPHSNPLPPDSVILCLPVCSFLYSPCPPWFIHLWSECWETGVESPQSGLSTCCSCCRGSGVGMKMHFLKASDREEDECCRVNKSVGCEINGLLYFSPSFKEHGRKKTPSWLNCQNIIVFFLLSKSLCRLESVSFFHWKKCDI